MVAMMVVRGRAWSMVVSWRPCTMLAAAASMPVYAESSVEFSRCSTESTSWSEVRCVQAAGGVAGAVARARVKGRAPRATRRASSVGRERGWGTEREGLRGMGRSEGGSWGGGVRLLPSETSLSFLRHLPGAAQGQG